MTAVEEHEDGRQDAASTDEIVLGCTLREAREQQGLDISDVVNQIKLAPSQIEALETGDYESLPEMTFVRGFVRSYAKMLHLDVAPLLALLPNGKQVSSLESTLTEEVSFDAQVTQKKHLIWLLVAMLLVVIVAVWQLTSSDEATPLQPEVLPLELPESVEVIPSFSSDDVREELTQLATKTVSNALEKTQAISSESGAGQQDSVKSGAIRLVFENNSWVKIRDKNKLLSSQLNLAGSELTIDGKPPFSLVIGRADAVHLYYRGKQIDLQPQVRSSSGVARLTLE